MSMMFEHFVLPPTDYVPNNRLPVIVYRDVLPKPPAEESTTEFLETNKWEKKGFWPGTEVHHFHPNTHECYGVVTGTTTMLVGRGQLDGTTGGQLVSLRPGDVIVIPAGVSHMNATMTEDYRFVGVYPRYQGSPRWTSQRCDRLDIMPSLKEEISRVPLPAADPVEGEDGTLIRLWKGIPG
ncbi:Cupin domain protein [Colletotrichum higginsianum IMI 349063]|uniref:Cupin domain protein n=1 Tax=Colletotrichum higginsianum (strain IMI 349063) TaxID=759273 RepID=A0A1B7YSM3_COLHI|nr:Cupin domain protein [Colletotrichum higginsianum IMI 349063]OBR15050.1 Cupin domain protein [Colletotrichum higginsianum IMI 349063]